MTHGLTLAINVNNFCYQTIKTFRNRKVGMRINKIK